MRISVNGKLVKHLQLTGSEVEFNYAYGVFETIRTYHGNPLALAAHLQRLRQSAKALHFAIPATTQQLQTWVQAHCSKRFDQRLKIIASPSTIYIFSDRLQIDPLLYQRGVGLTLYAYERPEPQIKSLARGHEYHAHSTATAHGYYDALLVNRAKQINEGAYCNIAIIKNHTIITPQTNILAGITRAIILQLCRQDRPRYRISYRPLTVDDFATADEAYLTQTSTGIVPVISLQRQRIGNGKVGPVTQTLMHRFQSYVTQHCR